MSAAANPIVVVEDDLFLRLIQVILDPQTPAARLAAFSHFIAHELPDFTAWCNRLRARLQRLYPAEVRLVADETALSAALHGARDRNAKVGRQPDLSSPSVVVHLSLPGPLLLTPSFILIRQ